MSATTPIQEARVQGSVRGLAWKVLYANHRPSLGPEGWEELVEAVDGPGRVKPLALDEVVALGPFVAALDRLGEDDDALRGVGAAFVRRWATMHQTLTEHLQGRPGRMLRVAVTEVFPWFFPDAEAPEFQRHGDTVRIALSSPVPDAFLEGCLAGFVEVAGGEAAVERVGAGRFVVAWDPGERLAPSRARVLFEATRARMLPATLAPVLVGTAVGAWRGVFDGFVFALALAGAVCLHLAFNLFNDVMDHRRGVDEANLTPTPFGGGSRVIQRGWMGSNGMLALAGALGGVGSLVGAYFVSSAGLVVLGLGALGVALGFAYSGGPFRLADRGLGELAAGVVFGPLLALGAFAVQAGGVGWGAFWVGVPLGVSMVGVLMVNGLSDARWDARRGRRSLVVRLGGLASWGAGLGVVAPFVVLAGFIAWGLVPVGGALALAVAPFALWLGHRLRVVGGSAEGVGPLQGPVVLLHASFGVLMALGIGLEGWWF